MRIIKFRGKKVNDSEFVYGSLFTLKYKELTAYFIEVDNNCKRNKNVPKMGILFTLNDDVYMVDPNTIGQYTGLKDMNGKEIYEGDIVRWQLPFRDSYTGNNGWSKSMLCEVKFEYGAFYINEYPYVLGKTLDFDDGKDWRLEVVGNIHEKKQENE